LETIRDFAIPEVKPAIELYRGEYRRKMGGEYAHARLQYQLAMLLDAWGRERGRIGIEWRFYFIERAGAPSSSLVPDVAFVSYDRLPEQPEEDAEQPTIAPDIAIEILSPDDQGRHVQEKIDLYWSYGTLRVVVVDPQTESLTIYE
jgi:Uma2 family endonuclease